MLEIRNASNFTLQLPSDEKLTVEINSTIFDTDDVIRGSYSYPFSFGLNDNNIRFIENGHLPESPMVAEMHVQVSAGAYSFYATLIYKTSGLYADASLLIDLGALADKIRNIPVREFVTETFFVGTDESENAGPTMLKMATAEPGVYPFVCPPFHNSEMVEEDFVSTRSNYVRPTIINKWSVGNPLPAHTGTLLGVGDWLIVPMVYMNWLISYICTKLGFAASGSLLTDPVLSRLIIFNTQSTPGLIIEKSGYTVEIGRHVGDYSIGDFFKAIRSYIGVSIDINVTSRKAIFNTYKSMLANNDYVDLSDYVVPGSYGVENSESKGFKVETYFDQSDTYVRYSPYAFDINNIQPKELKESFTFSVGADEDQIPLAIGTLRMDSFKSTNNITASGADWLIPAVKQSGNLADPFYAKSANYSPYVDANKPDTIPPAKNSWALRMLLYWGMKEDTAGNYYPYASSVSYDAKYRVFGSVSLQPGEPDDIWLRYQKQYYEFLAYSKKITVLTRLSLPKLSEINPSVPIGFKLNNFVLGKYLLEKMKYELPSQKGYVLAEFQGRQLIPQLLKATGKADGKLINSWIQLVMEHTQIIPNGNHSQNSAYANIIAYIWKDGLFSVPETNLGFLCEYRKCTTTYDVNQIATKTCTKESIYISGHRTVIEANTLYMISGNPRGLYTWVTWAMLDGDGYRAR